MNPVVKDAFKNASLSFQRRNPHLFGVGGVAAHGPKPAAVSALERGVQKPARGAEGMVIRVVLVAVRHRLLDGHDGVAYACKPLTDAIAASLGLDDADPRLHWEYHQIQTAQAQTEGVMVKVEFRHGLHG